MSDTAEVRVGIAVVEQQGRYLVGIRGDHVPLAGYSEFPGGKLRPGESPEAGAIRECREETGLDVEAVGVLHHCTHDYPHGRVQLTFILCRTVQAGPQPSRGTFGWLDAAELAGRDFPEANRPVVELLLGGLPAFRESPHTPAGRP